VAVGAVGGAFSLTDAGARFVLGAAGGIAIGLAVGWVMTHTRRAIEDPPTEIALSLVTPYFAYLPAEAAGVSAVLAAVTSGIYLGWRSPRIIAPQTRIQAFAVWEVVQFVLNAALFALVGLALPSVVRGIGDRYGWADALAYAAVVSGAVIVVRFLWVFPATYLPRAMSRRIRSRDPSPPWQHVFLVAWTGMRGGVSLAAALAIPTTLDSGAPLPMRDLVIFLTYAAIFATLVLQGLSLPWVMRALGLHDDGKDGRLEVKARIKAAKAAIARLEEMVAEEWVREETADRMRRLYEFRIRRFRSRFDPDDDGDIDAQSEAYQRLRREVLEAERTEIIRLRGDGFISDEVMHRIERDLDLEDARLEI
jgi:CPA1 family monovalent cation:H+ antiporter